MYLRHVNVRKNGKLHTYWTLVRSVRQGAKVRQEVVCHLGELDAEGRAKARALARRITGREHPGQLDFLEPPTEETVQVKLKGVRLERCRKFGDVWLAWVLWCALEFNQLFERLIPSGQEEVRWPAVLAALLCARLCEPSSELHIAEQWFRKSALDDLLCIAEDKLNYDRLYRGLEVLLAFKPELEKHIKKRMGELFEVCYDILLYDLTSTYCEGEEAGNELAQYGYNRDKRFDCKQVNIALLATREGLPLAYELFCGDTADVTTVQRIVTAIEAKFGKAGRIWIMDRGMVSAAVLNWLRGEKRPYIVGTPKSELKHFAAQLLEGPEWLEIREGLEVKQCTGPEGSETFILCRSAARKEKERAMRGRFAARIVEGLERMQKRLAHAQKRQDRGVLERQVGRLLQRNSRAAKLFEVQVRERADVKCGVEVVWQKREKVEEWAELSEGCYLLRASQVNWGADEMWRAYMNLVEVEEAFRIHKTELEVRPIWHWTADGVRAHILVCFIAYVLWKTLEQWSQRAGLGRSPRKLLEEFGQIQSADVILPTTDGRQLRVRCVTRPEKALSLLLDRLGLELPKRLRPPHCLGEKM